MSQFLSPSSLTFSGPGDQGPGTATLSVAPNSPRLAERSGSETGENNPSAGAPWLSGDGEAGASCAPSGEWQSTDAPSTGMRDDSSEHQEEAPSAGTILLVDDLDANLRLMGTILRLEGFHVLTASSGEKALALAEKNEPDVVLLDVMMPVMDGLEVCRRLRARQGAVQVPIIMVTALQNTEDKVRAIEAGANDFLSKPVDAVELVARVRSQVENHRRQKALDRAYQDLRHAEELRDSLSAMLVHDLRTPLTTVLTALDLMDSGQAGPLTEMQEQVLRLCLKGGRHLLELINQLLDISRMESGQVQLNLEPLNVAELLSEAISHVEPQARGAGVTIEVVGDALLHQDEEAGTVADTRLVVRALVNLVANAVSFSPRRCAVQIRPARTAQGVLRISVTDHGPGIAPRDHGRIFDRFGQAEARREGHRLSTGLGLTFCKLAMKAHGGDVLLESELGKGSTFTLVLPPSPTLPPTPDHANAPA